LIQEYLTTFNLKLYASKKYLQKHGVPKTIDDLDKHRIIAYGDSKMLFTREMEWALRVGRGRKPPRDPYMRISYAPGIYTAGRIGLGIITLIKENYYLRDGFLVPVLPELTGPSFKAYYTYPKH